MTRRETREAYFNWLCDIVRGDRFAKNISYDRLLAHLHEREFIWVIPRDMNRADDGIDLRYRFAMTQVHEDLVQSVVDDLIEPCSILEMMIALAIRCEENIMDDPAKGDRTGQWFWGMIVNMGLGSMYNTNYSKRVVDDALNTMLDRTYEPDGKGGLFTVRHCDRDLRSVEIWYQLLWYLDNIM